jgi:superkiller protein 3
MARRHLLDVALILSVALGVAYAGLTWQRFGELRKADLAWLHVLYLYPHSAFAASGVGQSFFEYDTSIEVSNRYYEIGYHLSPNDWRIAGAYGLTLNRLRRWEEAVPVLERSIEIAKEKYPDGLAELGDAYLALKHEQKAIDAFARRVLIDTTNASYRNDMGVVLAHFESYVEAIDQYQRARAIDPAMGIVALNLGDVLLKVNRPDLAEPQLRDAVELIEDDSVLWGGYGKLGLALSQMNRLPEAIVAYQKTVDLFDKDAEVWNNYGITLGKAGLLEEAIEAFEKAIKLDPDYSEPRENLDTVRALMLRPPAQPTPE